MSKNKVSDRQDTRHPPPTSAPTHRQVQPPHSACTPHTLIHLCIYPAHSYTCAYTYTLQLHRTRMCPHTSHSCYAYTLHTYTCSCKYTSHPPCAYASYTCHTPHIMCICLTYMSTYLIHTCICLTCTCAYTIHPCEYSTQVHMLYVCTDTYDSHVYTSYSHVHIPHIHITKTALKRFLVI